MKDLEIRGAGNLLGGEQSGHIAGVGFDLYVRLVGEAVASFRGDTDETPDRDQDRAARRRPPAARLRAARAAAARDVQEAGRRRRRGPARRHRGRAGRPLRRAARGGAQPARGGPPAHGAPGPPASATSACRATTCGSARSSCARASELRLQRLYPGSIVKHALGTVLVPKPMTARVGGRPLRDRECSRWAGDVIRVGRHGQCGAGRPGGHRPHLAGPDLRKDCS